MPRSIIVDARVIQPHYPGLARSTFGLVQALSATLKEQPAPTHELSALVSPQLDRAIDGPVTTVSALPFSWGEQRQLRDLVKNRRPDIFHTPYLSMPYAIGCPVVVTVHDLIPMILPRQSSLRARTLFRTALRLALVNADHVITPSQRTADDLMSHTGFRASKISVIPHGPSTQLRKPDPARLNKARVRYNIEGPYLLCVASHRPHKNIEGLLQAFALANLNMPLVLVAPRLGTAETGHGVIGLEAPSDSLLSALYAGATAVIIPSLYEGFGLVALEAFSHGAPLICSRGGSLPEVAADAAEYFNAEGPRDIARVIKRTLLSRQRLRELRVAGHDRLKSFSWPSIAEETLALYDRVADRSA